MLINRVPYPNLSLAYDNRLHRLPPIKLITIKLVHRLVIKDRVINYEPIMEHLELLGGTIFCQTHRSLLAQILFSTKTQTLPLPI